MSETPGHGDCARVGVSCGKGSDEGGKVGPAHCEVAGEDLVEALIKLGLNESGKGGWHVLVYLCLRSKVGVYFLCCCQEHCKLKHCWVALLWPTQDCHHDKPMLQHLSYCFPANYGKDALLFHQRCGVRV